MNPNNQFGYFYLSVIWFTPINGPPMDPFKKFYGSELANTNLDDKPIGKRVLNAWKSSFWRFFLSPDRVKFDRSSRISNLNANVGRLRNFGAELGRETAAEREKLSHCQDNFPTLKVFLFSNNSLVYAVLGTWRRLERESDLSTCYLGKHEHIT